jgi:carbamoyl-phosphate synthase small subunit
LVISETASKKQAEALQENVPALLVLEDGRSFSGIGFGARGTTVGELVFNTSLFGYQEILTDPSYAGQIVTLTYPEIGNYGTNDEDLESRQIFARGLVVRNLTRRYSSWRGTDSLDEFLQRFNVMGIAEVDTRAVTRHIRDKGAMRCVISTEGARLEELVKLALNSASMTGADMTAEVTTAEKYVCGSGKFKIAVIDYGIKKNIVNLLVRENMKVEVYPCDVRADDILASNPDGIFLSNGPGDPSASKAIISEVGKLIASGKPIFGICLGHQFLALALGAKTYKLKFGHRGGNQPVKDLTTGKVEVTCQNHGFAVDTAGLPACIQLTHVNLNDQSVEGFKHKTLPIMAVQYHPEASPGPHDSSYLFKRFYDLIEANIPSPS